MMTDTDILMKGITALSPLRLSGRAVLLAGLMSLMAAFPALAHSVWIEPTADGVLVVRFGELDGSFETSPGHLDALSLPHSFALSEKGEPTSLDASKQKEGYHLEKSSASAVTGIETEFSLMARGEPKITRRPSFYARWQPEGWAAGAPRLTLDIVPADEPGTARIYFRGKPLAGAQVKLHSPTGRENTLTADGQGLVKFEATKPGRWLLLLSRHSEELPGFVHGQGYDVHSHNASLCWVQK